jgi:hypothetical protein
LLDFASPVAANAIFSLTAIALDLSYIVPIALRRIFRHHPEVQFKPGPFYLGDGLLGWAVNLNCIVWTLFVSVIFSLPTYLPVTKNTMNYASVITGSVLFLAMYEMAPSLFCSDSSADTIFLSPQDLVLHGVRGCVIIKHGTVDTDPSCCSGRRHYHGPHAYVKESVRVAPVDDVGDGENDTVDSNDEKKMA